MSNHEYKSFTIAELMHNMDTDSYDDLVEALQGLIKANLVLDYKIGPKHALLLIDARAEIALFVDDEGDVQ